MGIQTKSGWQHQWLVCVPNISPDGSREREGNPIFWAVCEQLDRSIRIVQLEPNQGYPDIAAWVDDMTRDGRESGAQLVIQCIPDRHSEGVVLRLLEVFTSTETDQKDLEGTIATLLPTS